MKLTKIAVTGGPCAGKTEGLRRLRAEIPNTPECRLLFIPETATELISGGVAPFTCGSNREYQVCQIKLQLQKEHIFEEAARTMRDVSHIVLVCDRGAMDNRAYMNDEETAWVMDRLEMDERELASGYDAVFFLETAARTDPGLFSKEGNDARWESSPDEAVRLDTLTRSAWEKGTDVKVIPSNLDFEEKMNRFVEAVKAFLAEC